MKKITIYFVLILVILSFSCQKEFVESAKSDNVDLVNRLKDFNEFYYQANIPKSGSWGDLGIDSALYLSEAALNYSFRFEKDTNFNYTALFTKDGFSMPKTVLSSGDTVIKGSVISDFYTEITDLLQEFESTSDGKMYIIDVILNENNPTQQVWSVKASAFVNRDLPIDTCIDYTYVLEARLNKTFLNNNFDDTYLYGFYTDIRGDTIVSGNTGSVSVPPYYFVSHTIYHEEQWDGCPRIGYYQASVTYLPAYLNIFNYFKPVGKSSAMAIIAPHEKTQYSPPPFSYHNVNLKYGYFNQTLQ